ncbi:MAG: hypothetical protein KAX05_03400, partial [Bacteroidales bacterium]|nr:hypothetical protein [Bacteroidales bacterium]
MLTLLTDAKNTFIGSLLILLWLPLMTLNGTAKCSANTGFAIPQDIPQPDSTTSDSTIDLRYPFNDYNGNPFVSELKSGLYLGLPSNINSSIVYDPDNNEFV